jgi:hypothetical protein
MVGGTYVVIALSFGLAGGVVGRIKGSSFGIWFLIGAVLPLLGTLAAAVYRNERREARRQCPECGKVLALHVQVCTRCGRDLDWPDEVIPPGGSRPRTPAARWPAS